MVAVTAWADNPSKASSDASWTMAMSNCVVCGPSMMPISSTPVTVMVCGVSQSLVVNVIDPGVRVASVSSVDVMERTTSSVG